MSQSTNRISENLHKIESLQGGSESGEGMSDQSQTFDEELSEEAVLFAENSAKMDPTEEGEVSLEAEAEAVGVISDTMESVSTK